MNLTQLASTYEKTKKLYLGCKGNIYDVTENEMYADGQGYNCFIGKDASVALAKMKFDKEFLDPTLLHWSRDLNEEELSILKDWETKFDGKYKIVACIENDGKIKK